MANHKQALKRHRQSLNARARNKHFKTLSKTMIKKVYASEDGTAEEKTAAFRAAESVLTHVANKGIIPKKRVSRKISRLAKHLNQVA